MIRLPLISFALTSSLAIFGCGSAGLDAVEQSQGAALIGGNGNGSGNGQDAQTRALIVSLEEKMNARDYDTMDEIIADDFTRISEATPGLVIESRQQFVDFLVAYGEQFPDNIQTFTTIVAEGNKAGFMATYEGTHAGTGRYVKFDFAGVATMEDGKIKFWHVTWDNVTVLTQLGAM